MRSTAAIIAAAALLAATPPATAATNAASNAGLQLEEPNPTDILRGHINATYGDQLEKREVKSIKMVGALSIPQQGIEAEITLHQWEDGRVLRVNIPALGFEQVLGYTEGVAWAMQNGAAQVVDGEQAEAMGSDAKLYSGVDYLDKVDSASYVGTDEIDGEPCHILSVTEKGSDTAETRAFSIETGLLKRVETVADSPIGEVPSIQTNLEYTDIGGIKRPSRFTVEQGGLTQSFTFTEFELNPDVTEIKKTPAAVEAVRNGPN